MKLASRAREVLLHTARHLTHVTWRTLRLAGMDDDIDRIHTTASPLTLYVTNMDGRTYWRTELVRSPRCRDVKALTQVLWGMPGVHRITHAETPDGAGVVLVYRAVNQ